jgi:putative transposase
MFHPIRGILGFMDLPHAPLHLFGEAGIYFVTGATLHKNHFFRDAESLDSFQEILFDEAKQHQCWLQSWSLFSNHYHLVASADRGEAIRSMCERFHVETARLANDRDGVRGRKVWFQFRDTQLTFQRSWLARLKYTNENAVHHGLVADAANYRWCSASWFAATARASFVETVGSLTIDRVNVYDEFAPSPPER